MSDWEDEYDESGVAIDRAPRKQPPPERNGAQKCSQRENVCFGMKAARNGRTDEHQARGPDKGDRGRISRQSRFPGDERRDGGRPLVFNVEKAVIGFIIGRLQIFQRTSQNITFFQLTSLLIS